MGKSKPIPDVPVPVGPEAISPSVKKTETNPREDCENHKNQVDFTRLFERPANQYEGNDQEVSDVKKNIQNRKHVIVVKVLNETTDEHR
jgi:hypothetical protein